MISILEIFTFYWNAVIILCVIVLLAVFYFELKGMKTTKESSESKYENKFIENWMRMNSDFYNQLGILEEVGLKNLIIIIQNDFKKMLDIKYKINVDVNNEFKNEIYSKIDKKVYIEHITNPELKSFMDNPLTWFKPHFMKIRGSLNSENDFKSIRGSQDLFPVFIRLENMIIAEINDNLLFKHSRIESTYESFLIAKNLSRDRPVEGVPGFG